MKRAIEIDILQENIRVLKTRISTEKHEETAEILYQLVEKDQKRINELSAFSLPTKPSLLSQLIEADTTSKEEEIAFLESLVSSLTYTLGNFKLTNLEKDDTQYLIDRHTDRIQEMKEVATKEKDRVKLNALTTVADTFYRDIEKGQVIPPVHLLEYFDLLVDYLEKNGGNVIEEEETT